MSLLSGSFPMPGASTRPERSRNRFIWTALLLLCLAAGCLGSPVVVTGGLILPPFQNSAVNTPDAEFDGAIDRSNDRSNDTQGSPTPATTAQLKWTEGFYPTGHRDSSTVHFNKGIPATISLGKNFQYQLKVSNLTDRIIEGLVVVDTLPEGLDLIDATEFPTAMYPNRAEWHLSPLLALEQRVIWVTARARTGGSLNATLQIRCSDQQLETRTQVVAAKVIPSPAVANKDGAPVHAAYTANEGMTISVVEPPRLSFWLRGPAHAQAGEPFTYTMELTNPGAKVARDVQIECYVPDGCAVIAAPGATRDSPMQNSPMQNSPMQNSIAGRTCCVLTWSLAQLQAGEKRLLTVAVQPEKAGNIEIFARGQSTSTPTVEASTRTEVRGEPAIQLKVVPSSHRAAVGDTITYEITVTNAGTDVDTSIHLRCRLHENMYYPRWSGSSRAKRLGSLIDFAPIRRLLPGEKAVWQLEVVAGFAGHTRLEVSVDSRRKTDTLTRSPEADFYPSD